MSYMHIDNLYKNTDILLFKECYALEKIHGTSAHIGWNSKNPEPLHFFSGGSSYLLFVKLFDHEFLKRKFLEMNVDKIKIYGEAYGGKLQGMSSTYGNVLRFVAFEAQIGESWLDVLNAEQVVNGLGLDFVPYEKCPTNIDMLNLLRDKPSEQAVKCGITEPMPREGIILRPLIELTKNNGSRIISKHKNEAFASHVLDNFPDAGIEKTGDVIRAMVEDVERESVNEIVKSKEARKAISTRTAQIFKKRISKI